MIDVKQTDVMSGRLLLRISEVVQVLGLSRTKVYHLIYYEGLPVMKFGKSVRVPVEDLRRWIERRKEAA